MEVVRCLVKALTHENARLKKQSVEAKLDNDMLEVAARNDAAAARREAAAPLKQVPCSGEHGRHWVWTAARCGTAAADRMTVSFAPSYARSLPFAGASAVAGCMAVAAGRIAPNHKKLRRLYAEDPDGWLLPWAILPEVDYLVGRELGSAAQRAWLNDLASGAFEIEWGSAADVRAARTIEARYHALAIGLVDAVVMATAERLRADIATFDFRHFGAVRLAHAPRLLPGGAPRPRKSTRR